MKLDELSTLANELGFTANCVDERRLDVALWPGTVLAFCNQLDEDDTLVGFEGSPWHFHGIVQFMIETGTYVEQDELDILSGLGTGDLVVVSRYLWGELKDR